MSSIVERDNTMDDELKYDSRNDTTRHIWRVQEFIHQAVGNLQLRAINHDASKLEEPEKPYFDRLTPRLAELRYGSQEYKESLRELGVALEHHYEHNSHHPEHYKEGVAGMSLLDLVEMLCDWRAASERTKQRADGDEYLKRDFMESLAYNRERFGMDDQLFKIIVNTARELGFVE